VDLELSVITIAWERLTGDPALTALLGGPGRVHLGLPDEDEPPLPYLNHRVATSANQALALRDGTYYLDAWDVADTAERIFQVRSRVIDLLDELVAVGEGATVRFSLAASGLIPEPEPGVWHVSLTFSILASRAGELAAIAARSNQ
jgi:hypothetical protein